MKQKEKRIDWAFPTSRIATELGHRETGCWIVELCRYQIDGTPLPPQTLAGFPEFAAALEYAESIDRPWHPGSKRFQCKKCKSFLPAIPGYETSTWRHCPCGRVATLIV